jgi:hypothetical protein
VVGWLGDGCSRAYNRKLRTDSVGGLAFVIVILLKSQKSTTHKSAIDNNCNAMQALFCYCSPNQPQIMTRWFCPRRSCSSFLPLPLLPALPPQQSTSIPVHLRQLPQNQCLHITPFAYPTI